MQLGRLLPSNPKPTARREEGRRSQGLDVSAMGQIPTLRFPVVPLPFQHRCITSLGYPLPDSTMDSQDRASLEGRAPPTEENERARFRELHRVDIDPASFSAFVTSAGCTCRV
jgi:hypothetical protein